MDWSAEDLARYELELRDARAWSYDRDYDRLHGPLFPSVEIHLIHRALNLSQHDILLDLGCGTGRLTEQLAPLVEHIIAVDRSGGSLDVLRDRLKKRAVQNVTIIQADAVKALPINRRVSKVLSVQLLQHLPTTSDRSSALRHAAEWLDRGGRCVVIDEVFGLVRRVRGKPREVAKADALCFHTFTGKEMRNIAKQAGLKPIRFMGCGPLYWTRYGLSPKVLTRLDEWSSRLPGAWLVSKFGATIAVKD